MVASSFETLLQYSTLFFDNHNFEYTNHVDILKIIAGAQLTLEMQFNYIYWTGCHVLIAAVINLVSFIPYLLNI